MMAAMGSMVSSVMAVTPAAADTAAVDMAAARAALAPHGVVRFALVEAPDPGLIFVARAADGTPKGVTADLAADCARALGARATVTLFPNTGAATEAVRTGTVDVSFMPVDATRRDLVAFGPAYYDLQSTYLVTGASGLKDVADVDRPGVRVVAIAGTTPVRPSSRTLTKPRPVAVTSVGEGIAAMKEGRADALALSRDTLAPIVAQVPGSRIVTGGFQETQVAVAVAKDHRQGLAFVTAWLTGAKRDGTIARVFAAHGFGGQAVAAP